MQHFHCWSPSFFNFFKKFIQVHPNYAYLGSSYKYTGLSIQVRRGEPLHTLRKDFPLSSSQARICGAVFFPVGDGFRRFGHRRSSVRSTFQRRLFRNNFFTFARIIGGTQRAFTFHKFRVAVSRILEVNGRHRHNFCAIFRDTLSRSATSVERFWQAAHRNRIEKIINDFRTDFNRKNIDSHVRTATSRKKN